MAWSPISRKTTSSGQSHIERIIVSGRGLLRDISGKSPVGDGPSAVVSAHLSIPYTVAVVLIEGDLTLENFTQAKVVERHPQEGGARDSVEVDSSLGYNDLAPSRLTVLLRSDEALRGECAEFKVGMESALERRCLSASTGRA